MICKIRKRKNIGVTLGYNLKQESEFIGAKNLVGDSFKDFELQMKDTQKLYNGRGENTVAHVILSPAIDDSLKISQSLWKELAEDFLREARMTELESAFFLHRDRDHYHLHIVVNKINAQGKMYHAHDEMMMGREIAHKLAKKHNLISARDVEKENARIRADNGVPGINGRTSIKNDCIEAVTAALRNNDKFNLDLYFQILSEKGYRVEFYHDKDTGKVRGYGLGWGGDGKDENFYKSSQIGREFTLSRIGKTALNLHKKRDREAVKRYWDEFNAQKKAAKAPATGISKSTAPIKHYDFRTKKVTEVPARVRDQFVLDCPATAYQSPEQWEKFVSSKGYKIDLNRKEKKYSITNKEGYSLNANEIGKPYTITELEKNKFKRNVVDMQAAAKANRDVNKIIDEMDTSDDDLSFGR